MRQTFALLAVVALAATLNAQTAPPGGAKPAVAARRPVTCVAPFGPQPGVTGTRNPPIDLKTLVFVLAGVIVLHQTLFGEPWALADHQEASSVAKFMAASQIVLWFGVLYFGRMIPYLMGGTRAGAL